MSPVSLDLMTRLAKSDEIVRMVTWDGAPEDDVMDKQPFGFSTQQTTLTVAPPDEHSDCVPSLAASADLAARPVWIERPAAPVHGIAWSSACFQAGHYCRAKRRPWGIQFRMLLAVFTIAMHVAKQAAGMAWLARIVLAAVWANNGDLSPAFAHDSAASLAASERLVGAFGIELAEVPSEDSAFFAAPFTSISDRCSHSTSPACLFRAWLLGARGPEPAPVG